MIECAKLIGVIFLLIYLFIALTRWLKAQLFPSGAGFDMTYNSEDPIFKELHQYNWTLLKALAWPVFGVPNETRSIQGLKLVAQKGGARLHLHQSDKSALIESLGDTIEQITEDNPNTKSYKLVWGDSVERRGLGEHVRLTLLQSVLDRQK